MHTARLAWTHNSLLLLPTMVHYRLHVLLRIHYKLAIGGYPALHRGRQRARITRKKGAPSVYHISLNHDNVYKVHCMQRAVCVTHVAHPPPAYVSVVVHSFVRSFDRSITYVCTVINHVAMATKMASYVRAQGYKGQVANSTG